MSELFKNIPMIIPILPQQIWESLYSTILSTFFAYIIGLPLGVLLATGGKDGILKFPTWLKNLLDAITNLLRSVPFLLLMMVTLPISKLLFGTQIGTIASIPPLVIAAFPFIARLVETSLREVDKGVIEAAQSMGCSPLQIITKVMIPESVPTLISGATTAFITILGYGAMAGIIGGGGLGNVGITYGYYRYKYDIMWFIIILLVLLVQIFQTIGARLSVKSDKRISNNEKRRTKK